MKIDVITLPVGATAAYWVSEAGTEMQAVGLGDEGVLFGARRPGGTWQNTTITNPERFGDWKTRKQMQAWAEAFINAAMNGD